MTDMNRTLLFATNNAHKIGEVRLILGDSWTVTGLQEAGITADLPETSDTLEGNARQKAAFIRDHYGLDCFAEDTGLEVEVLGGIPGVHTARYAGPDASPDRNMAKLLGAMRGQEYRMARFRTVIALFMGGEDHLFEGEVRGRIAHEPSGTGGFGYDPIFIPEGYSESFAVLSPSVKKEISHRARAIRAMTAFLATM